jgi:hypothetical protein
MKTISAIRTIVSCDEVGWKKLTDEELDSICDVVDEFRADFMDALKTDLNKNYPGIRFTVECDL